MAWIEERTGKQVGWRVAWRRNGKRESLTFDDEPTAERCRKLVESTDHQVDATTAHNRLHNRADTAAVRTITLDEWAATWFPNKTGVQVDTVERYRRQYAMHIAPVEVAGRHMGAYPLTEITPLIVRGWITAATRKGMSAVNLRRVHGGVLHQLLRDAVREGHLAENPAAYSVLPREDHDEDEDPKTFLTHDEAQLLVGAMEHQLGRDVVTVLLGTGLRWSELTALQTRDVDPLAKTPAIRVQRVWKRSKANGWYLGAPKSKRSRRTLTVSPDVLEVLIRRMDLTDDEALVFGNAERGRLDHSNFYRAHWRPALRLATGWLRISRPGLTTLTVPVPRGPVLAKRPTPHDLRHTHASWLIADGVHLVRVSRRLGHDSTAFTEKIYVHLLGDDDAEMLAGLDRALARQE